MLRVVDRRKLRDGIRSSTCTSHREASSCAWCSRNSLSNWPRLVTLVPLRPNPRSYLGKVAAAVGRVRGIDAMGPKFMRPRPHRPPSLTMQINSFMPWRRTVSSSWMC